MKSLVAGLLGAVVVGTAVSSMANTEFPLKMDIDVSTRRSSQNIGAGKDGEARVERTSLRVKIRRASGSADEQLKAEVYVIGRQIQTGYFGIIDVVKKDFSFEKERTFEFTTREYALGRTSGNINVGGVYETFLVVVTDENGEVLDSRSGRVIGEKGIALIREMGPQTLFDRDGNVVGKVDDNHSAFKRAVPAASNPGSDY